jgi:hypothetical protein
MATLQKPAAARRGLLSLPNEVLAQVVGYFSASPADMNLEKSPAFTTDPICTDYRTLSALRLTCKRLSSVSIFFMYRVVEVLDEQGMVFLIRTLLEHPDLRSLVLHLSLTFEIEHRILDAGLQAMISCWADNFVPLPPMNQQDETVFRYINVGGFNCVDVAGIIYGPTGIMGGILAVVLYLIPAVDTLRITANSKGTYNNAQQGAMQTLRAMMEDLARNMQTLPPLSSLRRLQIGTHQSLPKNFAGRTNHWSVINTFCGLSPKIRTIEDFQDHGKWDEPLASITRPDLNTGSVSEVSVLHCRTLGNLSARIAKSFPNIRRLSLKVCTGSALHSMSPWRTVNAALLELADTLEFLHLELPLRLDVVDQLGEDKRLTCLPRLLRLKQLYIPVGALCRDYLPYKSEPSAAESPLALFSLADSLPNRLESLHLAESLQMAFHNLDVDDGSRRLWRKGEYDHAFISMILEFCTRRSHKQPKLRYFCLLPTRETDILQSHLPVIKSACDARHTAIEVEIRSRSNSKKGRYLL